MDDLTNAFLEMDYDNRNFLDFKQFKSFIKKGYHLITDDELSVILKDTSDKISCDKFKTLVIKIQNIEIEKMFYACDTNNDGLINAKELHQLILKYNSKLNENQISSKMEPYDTDNDGCINFEEFISMLSKEKNVYYFKE